MSEHQNASDFIHLNATASTFRDMGSIVIRILFILSIFSAE